jgi:hypothetical protein
VALYFMLGWARCDFRKMRVRTCYAELVFIHLVGSAGHIGHSCASEARNIDAPFFILGWAQYNFRKKCVGTH